MKSERLREALLEVGFQLNTSVLSAVMFRYIRKDGTLRFGDFVAIILNLTVAFCTYTFLLYFLIRPNAKISLKMF